MGAPSGAPAEPRRLRLLALVIVFGFIVRMVGILWGIGLLPFDHAYYHPDEPKVANYVRHFPESFWTQADFRYPVAFHHALCVVYTPTKWMADIRLVQQAATGNAHRLWAFLVCRLGVVLMGTATIGFVYASVRHLTGRDGPALLGALMASLFPYAVLNSAFATTDVPLALMVVVVFYVCIRLAGQVPQVRWGWFGLGLLAGLATGVKYTGVFLLPALTILMLLQHRAAGCDWKTLSANLARLAVGTLVGFVLAMPHGVFRFRLVLHSLRYEMGRIESRDWSVVEYLDCYWTAFGWPGTVLVAGAAFLLAWKRPRGTVELGTFLLFFVLLTLRGLQARYVITIAPLAAVAFGCAAALPALRAPRVQRLFKGGCYALVAASGVLLVTCLYGRYAWDTRSQATRYIQAHYPADTTVYQAVLGTDQGQQQWRLAHFAKGEYPEVKLRKSPRLIIATTPPHELLERDRKDRGRRWMLWRNEYGLEPPPKEWADLYEALAVGTNTYRMVARFPQTRLPIEFPGYPLTIYERQAD